MKVKHIGLDESGKIGDENIYFCNVEIEQEKENDVFIQNLLNSKYFFLPNKIVQGWDSKKKIKLCNTLVNTEFLNVRLYKLNTLEQNKILYDVNKALGKRFFNIREELIEMYNKNRKDKKLIEKTILNLKIFSKPYKIYDYFLKSYAYLNILNNICNSCITQNYLEVDDQLIRVEIDGGYPFTFWWYNFIKQNEKCSLLQNKLFISGITHGDEYYLPVNIADFIVKTVRENRPKFYNYKTNDISYDFQNLKYSKNLFSEEYFENLINPYTKYRMLFLGNSDLFEILPFIFYKNHRKITYEPFKIRSEDHIKNFFKNFPIQGSKKILVIHSNILKKQEKENIKYCESKGLEIHNILDYKEEFNTFFDGIEESSEYYTDNIKQKVQSIIQEKKSLLK